jgi:hypothetical protein
VCEGTVVAEGKEGEGDPAPEGGQEARHGQNAEFIRVSLHRHHLQPAEKMKKPLEEASMFVLTGMNNVDYHYCQNVPQFPLISNVLELIQFSTAYMPEN